MVNEVQYIKKTVIKSSKWYMLRMKMYKSDREKIIFCWEMSKDFVKVVQSLSYIWLCDPMDCNTPDFPVLHHLPELDQTNVHWVGDAVQPCVILFSSCLQSFPASGSLAMSRLFSSCGESTGASASVPSMNIQDCFPLGLTGLIFLQSKWLPRLFSNATVQKH